jgi:hypothetical protein
MIVRDENGEQRTIKPFFGTGMRIDPYLPRSRDRPLDLVDKNWQSTVFVVKDNQTYLDACMVSRSFADIAPKVFYSHNKFTFTDPRVASWFFGLIGKRFKHMKHVAFEIKSGLETYAWNHTLTESKEGLWYNVLCWIQYRHRFDKLHIRFLGPWPEHLDKTFLQTENREGTEGTIGSYENVVEEMRTSRENLKLQLGKLRDIREPRLVDEWNLFRNNSDIMDTELLMKQKGEGEKNGLTDEQEEQMEELEREKRQAAKVFNIRRLLEQIHRAKNVAQGNKDPEEGDAPGSSEEEDGESNERPDLVNAALSKKEMEDPRSNSRDPSPAASHWGFDPPTSRSAEETEPSERNGQAMRYRWGSNFDAMAEKFRTKKKVTSENTTGTEDARATVAMGTVSSTPFYGESQSNPQTQPHPGLSQAQGRSLLGGKKYGKKNHAQTDIWGH